MGRSNGLDFYLEGGGGEDLTVKALYCTNKNIDTDGQPISFLLLTIYVLIRGRFKWNTELQLTLLL